MRRRALAALNALPGAEAERIFDLIEAGRPIVRIATEVGCPRAALYDWLDSPERAARFGQAKMRAATSIAEETIEIADNVPPDPAAIARARLKIGSRHWLCRACDKQTFGE